MAEIPVRCALPLTGEMEQPLADQNASLPVFKPVREDNSALCAKLHDAPYRKSDYLEDFLLNRMWHLTSRMACGVVAVLACMLPARRLTRNLLVRIAALR